jgi:hypothetical protein
MCTWVVIGIIVLLVLIIGAWRTRRIPRWSGVHTHIEALGKRYLGEDWSDKFAPASSEQIQNADRLIAYAERYLDRQISKGRGILIFNAIILAVIIFERTRMPDTLGLPSISIDWLGGPTGFVSRALALVSTCEIQVLYLAIATMLGLALSSLFCLALFTYKSGSSRGRESFYDDVAVSLRLVSKRGRKVEWATVIAQACLIVAVALVIIAEFNVRGPRSGPPISASAGTAILAAADLHRTNRVG